MQCNIPEAQNQLFKLVQAAMDGEDVVIVNQGIPLVRLVKIENPPGHRQPGARADLPPTQQLSHLLEEALGEFESGFQIERSQPPEQFREGLAP